MSSFATGTSSSCPGRKGLTKLPGMPLRSKLESSPGRRMNKDNVGYCPAYLQPQRVKGTSPGHPEKRDSPLRQGFVLPKAALHLRDAVSGEMRILTLPGHRDAGPGHPTVLVRSPELSLLQKGCDDARHRGVLRPNWRIMRKPRDTARCATK